MDPTSPLTAINLNVNAGDLPTDPSDASADQTKLARVYLGDADTNLVFQPGEISTMVLYDPGHASRLFQMREKLGWFFGKGLRTGDGQNCRYISHMESSMSVGINNPGHPGYVIGVLTLPNVPTFANWGGDDDSIYNNSMPADKDWESLDFLNPLWSVTVSYTHLTLPTTPYV